MFYNPPKAKPAATEKSGPTPFRTPDKKPALNAGLLVFFHHHLGFYLLGCFQNDGDDNQERRSADSQ